MTRPISRDGKKARPGTPLLDRLLLHVDKNGPGGCWLWTAALDRNGYGRIQIDGKLRYAHRTAYTLLVGQPARGLELDHLCRNPTCCNPEHLEPVSPSVNVRRGMSPGAKALRRTCCLYGHAYAEFGFFHGGRRRCSECQRVYLALWKQTPYAERMRRKWAGEKVIDLAAHFAAQRAVEVAA